MSYSSARQTRTRPSLLLIERDPSLLRQRAKDLPQALGLPLIVQPVASGRAGAEALRASGFEVVIADLSALGDLAPSPQDAIGKLARLSSGALLIGISDGGSVSAALAAMQAGAHDVLGRPITPEGLASRIRELALRHGKVLGINPEPPAPTDRRDVLAVMGEGSPMRIIMEQIERAASQLAPVFITGERGTGKVAAAEALHEQSAMAGAPLAVFDCAESIEDPEAALFGFTRQPGALGAAASGTLVLKNIELLGLNLQERLVRTLHRELQGAGDTRLVCITTLPPMRLVAERRLREDLFYLLHGLPIHIPPLRQRPGDIAPLARHFLAQFSYEERKRFSGFSAEAISALQARDWPGNARQLHTLVRRVVILFEGGEIGPDMVNAADFEARKAIPAERAGPDKVLPMWQQEQRIIEQAIESFAGNIALAAAALEISPSTIYRKRQSWTGTSGAA